MVINLRNEEWKDIIGYEGFYKISNLGRVQSVANKGTYGKSGVHRRLPNILLKHYTCKKNGYPRYSLSKDGKDKHFKLHRLLAIHFIPNPNNLPYVNHINGVRNDFRLENLEWCTPAENVRHAFAMGAMNTARGERNHFSISVLQITTGLFFETITEAALAFRIDNSYLCAALKGKMKKGKMAKNSFDLVILEKA